ncbi:hypothetical protein F5X99DRAFT_404947 [Biscogniauxia marginata]|nr:hypothetical protein F5X99DRAFT_404947 [Biscogniauxia marginata]
MDEHNKRAGKAVVLAKAFVDENAGSIHPVVAVPSYFVEAKQQYILREDYSDLEETLDKFVEAMRGAKFPMEFDPKSCTWNDVLDQLDRATQESDSRQKKWYRKARRTAASIGDDVSPWLKLIPSENGLSVLNGGLAVFFLATKYAERNREDILVAFKDILAAIQKAADKSTAFPSNSRLKECVKELYRIILQELPHLIEMLLHKQLKHRLLAPVTTQSTHSQIEERLKHIKRKVADLEDLTTNLTQLTTVHTLHSVTAMQEKQNQSISLQQHSVTLQEYSLSKQEQNKNESIAALGPKEAIAPRNALLKLLTDHNEKFIEQARAEIGKLLKQKEEERSRQQSLGFLSLDEVLDIVSVDPLKAENDLRYVLRQGINFNTISRGQARYLVQREGFKDWFLSRDPDLLVVNGNLNTSTSSRISPLSLVCAEIVEFINGIDDILALHFFCSENMAAGDRSSGPQRIMRSLLAQLLDLLHYRGCLSLEFIDSRRWQQRLEELDLETLCLCFWKLINQLPTISLYCIIDGMSLYEREEWKHDMQYLTREFGEMVHDDKLRPRLKVLMTYATRARYIEQVVERDLIISLRVGETDRRRVSDRLAVVLEN